MKRRLKAQHGLDVEEFIALELSKHIDATRPDRIQADYARVMKEAGLMPADPKIWVPKGL